MRRATKLMEQIDFNVRVSTHARHATGDLCLLCGLFGCLFVSTHARHATGDRAIA